MKMIFLVQFTKQASEVNQVSYDRCNIVISPAEGLVGAGDTKITTVLTGPREKDDKRTTFLHPPNQSNPVKGRTRLQGKSFVNSVLKNWKSTLQVGQALHCETPSAPETPHRVIPMTSRTLGEREGHTGGG